VNYVTIKTPALHGQASAFGTPVMGLEGQDKEGEKREDVKGSR